MNNIVFQNPEDQEWETFQKEIAAEVNQIRISSSCRRYSSGRGATMDFK